MKQTIATGTLAFALLLAGCGGGDSANQTAPSGPPQLEQIPAPNNGNWAEVVTRTEEGGIMMGNPEAPVKLVEYASMTCPVCARFSVEGSEALRDTYVRSGQVSWEFRNFVLNGPDMALSILSRCLPDAAFFPTVEQIFTQQQELMGRIDDEEAQRIGAMPPEQQLAPIARAMELDTFFARRGLPEARFNQCLTTDAARELSEANSRAAEERQVNSTPTFFLNGERMDVTAWSAVEPALRQALGN